MLRPSDQPGARSDLEPKPALRRCRPAFGSLVLLLFLASSSGCRREGSPHPVTTPVSIHSPLGLPPVPIPPGNPPTAAAIHLGRELFYETRLSKNNTVSCSSCHNPTMAFTDGRAVSTGVGGLLGVRNAPTLLNSVFSPVFFWDGRSASLEDQAGVPISNPSEMNQAHDVTISKIAAATYEGDFTTTFGPGKVTIEKVEMAIASFERTLLSADSPFDRYEYGGDKTALTPAAIRGLAIFTDPVRGNCSACHTIDQHTALFSDYQFHNLGTGYDSDTGFKDTGRFAVTHNEADRGAFRTPTLRDIALTAPYMHDGSLKTLNDVVDFYAGGGNSNPNLDKNIRSIHLSGRDRADLVSFLQSLTGGMPANVGPPSQLPPAPGVPTQGPLTPDLPSTAKPTSTPSSSPSQGARH